MFNNVRIPLIAALTTLLTASLAPALTASPAGASAAHRAVSRPVVFRLVDNNSTAVACTADGAAHPVRGRLVGPPKVVAGHAGPLRINVLVHDEGTGAWFWNLRSHAAYDYARQLARRGETSLVLDRLGYGASPLADGRSTCLGAQADMLHQVVQHLRSGQYAFTDGRGGIAPGAAHVVTQGHGLGAAIAQVEAATFDDVDGLVLMSWTDRGNTATARRLVADQSSACLSGAARTTYAPVTADAATFRQAFFASAPERVQLAAAARRARVPCGDVGSVSPMVLASNTAAGEVDAPVLLLFGSKDALNRPDARADQAASYPTRVTTRTFAGAGSALPLERPRAVRSAVLAWLRR